MAKSKKVKPSWYKWSWKGGPGGASGTSSYFWIQGITEEEFERKFYRWKDVVREDYGIDDHCMRFSSRKIKTPPMGIIEAHKREAEVQILVAKASINYYEKYFEQMKRQEKYAKSRRRY